jgi:hypothetical protein
MATFTREEVNTMIQAAVANLLLIIDEKDNIIRQLIQERDEAIAARYAHEAIGILEERAAFINAPSTCSAVALQAWQS